MAPSKAQRWLDLLALLVGNRFPISIDQVMEEVPAYRDKWAEDSKTARATARRMFERDKAELRRLGIPLETRRFRVDGLEEADGYLIRRDDFYLPYLELISGDAPGRPRPSPSGRANEVPKSHASKVPNAIGRVTLPESDVRTAIQALREVVGLPGFPFTRDARSALRKLTFDLDPTLGVEAEPADRVTPPVVILDRPGGADPEGVLGSLFDALYDRRRISFLYHSIGRDAVERREVEPWGLLFQWGAWYLAARDPQRDQGEPRVRLFRVDRMKEAQVPGASTTGPDFTVPDGFDIRAHAGRKAWELEGTDEPAAEVLVRFHPPAALLAERNGWGEPFPGAHAGDLDPEDPVPEPPDPAEPRSKRDQPRGLTPGDPAPKHPNPADPIAQHRDAGSSTTNAAILRVFSVRRLDPFLRWILPMAGDVEVLSPPEAVRKLDEMAREIIARHRTPVAGGDG